ncbi:chorion peroxidase [Choristoneura fumiferana]|uniref:chorion peroxidase n=1 Tax=Choristoneura fumiferana TaxID=7141 RepID=UPI003D156116
MNLLRFVLYVFLYVVVVCPSEIVTQKQGKISLVSRGGKSHQHTHERPCDVCPRHGRCVPRIQCPAHLRPGAASPLCHLAGQRDLVGVCCFTGSHHAGEGDLRARAAVSLPAEEVKTAHKASQKKLAEWLSKAQKLSKEQHVLVNTSSPSFAHHLSVMTYDQRAEQLSQGALMNLFAAQELKARQAISDEDLALGLTEHADGPFCPPPPNCPSPPSRYRSIEGECNNPDDPTWGAVHTGYERLLPPDYSDGIWGMRISTTGLPLPSARLVSHRLLLDANHLSNTHNLMFMQFGQFIAHDISAGVVFTIGNGSAISCCAGDGETPLPEELQHWGCAPIATGPEDPFYSTFRHTCLNFVRAQLAPTSDCSVGYAKQMNGATHYVDLSQLYGNSLKKPEVLRGPGGLLRTFNDYGRDLPPLTERKECLTTNEGAACFESGDNHGNQVLPLTVLHTIFTREHNRVAQALTRLNPDWEEDVVFMETRRILQAEFQHIIYNEWLPMLLGPRLVQAFGLSPAPGYSSSYDPHVNPALTTEFSTAAMRFGHSVVDGKFMVPSPSKGTMHEAISLPEIMFQPSRLRLRHFLDRALTGLAWQPMQAVDPFVTESLTRYLFHGGNPFGLDLAAINVQRARDYGVRGYNHYRKLIGLQPYTDFGQFSPSAAQRLSSVYNSPEDIDLWIGGLLEGPVDGGIVGATFANIIADQFSKMKRGDRYFYEHGPDVNPGVFTPSQLAEIKKVTLSRIICDNKDGIELFSQPPSAFLRADLPGNEPVPCDSSIIPTMDLSRFKDI